VRKVIDYVRQICDGLAAAHNRGLASDPTTRNENPHIRLLVAVVD
jgi:hypothetical protein